MQGRDINEFIQLQAVQNVLIFRERHVRRADADMLQ